MNRVLKTLKKNSREQIRISLTDFTGRPAINIRVFYPSPNGEWLPGKQGLAFAVTKLPEFRDALQEVATLIEEGGETSESDETVE